MANAEIVKRVNNVLITFFELDPKQLVPNAHFINDLELDSLDAVDLLVHLEDQMNLKVDIEKFRSVAVLSDIYRIVEEMMTQEKNKGERSTEPEALQ